MIHQAVKNLQALVHLYAKALTSWHREDPDHHKVWNNFKDCMHTQYEMMLQERGGGTLTDDGYITFNIIVNEDTAILTEAMVNYAEQLARMAAQVDALQAQLEAMAMQQQPRVENFTHNAVYQPPMGLLPRYIAQQECGFYMLQ